MSKCFHTGLPQNMCGHCSGTRATVPDPFTGRPFEDETPRLQKGRDSAKWVGRGEHQPASTHLTPGLASAALALPRFDGMRGRSAWAQAQAERSLVDYVKAVGFIPVPTEAPIYTPPAPAQETGGVEHSIHPRTGNPITVVRGAPDFETRTRPPRNTSRPIPAKPNYEVCGHARTKRNARQRKDW